MYHIYRVVRRTSGGLDLNAVIVVHFRLDIVHQVEDFKHDLCYTESKNCHLSLMRSSLSHQLNVSRDTHRTFVHRNRLVHFFYFESRVSLDTCSYVFFGTHVLQYNVRTVIAIKLSIKLNITI